MSMFYRFHDIMIYWSKSCIFSQFLPIPVSFEALISGHANYRPPPSSTVCHPKFLCS